MYLSQFFPSLIPKRNYGLLCGIILAMNSFKLTSNIISVFKTWFPGSTSCNYFFHKGQVEIIIYLRTHVEVALNIKALFNIDLLH